MIIMQTFQISLFNQRVDSIIILRFLHSEKLLHGFLAQCKFKAVLILDKIYPQLKSASLQSLCCFFQCAHLYLSEYFSLCAAL